MRVCLVYDCLFPWTIGGFERWLRTLAERLAVEGYEVTYLTIHQWSSDNEPAIPGIEVVSCGRRRPLYGRGGRRRVIPAIAFGVGVFWHLFRYGARYDVVHVGSFPYLSVLAADIAKKRRFGIVVDWVEFWTREYWARYFGRALGSVGWSIQNACARLPHIAVCHSELTASRLRAAQPELEVVVARGMHERIVAPATTSGARSERAFGPGVVFAGRHTAEKRVGLLVRAFALARKQEPSLVLHLFGDGPERAAVQHLVVDLDLGERVFFHGWVDSEVIDQALREAACVALASEREGFGLIIIEAAARGCPSVVVTGSENAAVELVVDGVNGLVARSDSPDELASAIIRVVRGASKFRSETTRWYAAHAKEFSLEASLPIVIDVYARAR